MLLAISTSSKFGSITLFDSNGIIIQTLSNDSPNCQSRDMPIMTKNILSNVNKIGLTNIFVDIGPGGFTGIRTGISLAIGLGLLGAKISGVCSLGAINYSLPQNKKYLIAINAMSNEYYYQVFSDYKSISNYGCVENVAIENLANSYNAIIYKNSELNSELIGNYGIYLAKNNIYGDIFPIYIKTPNIYPKKSTT